MALFRIVPRGDLEIVNNLPSLLTGMESRRQKLSQRFKFFLGEWFLDQRQGVPYFRHVFVKNPNLDVVRRLFRKIVVSVDGVTSVPRFELRFEPQSRNLYFDFEAVFDDGERLVVAATDREFVVTI
jgi:hypothetical protein